MVRRVLPLSWPLLSTPSIDRLLLRPRCPLKLSPLPWPAVCCAVTPATVREKSRILDLATADDRAGAGLSGLDERRGLDYIHALRLHFHGQLDVDPGRFAYL
jgi:hypothetical protein